MLRSWTDTILLLVFSRFAALCEPWPVRRRESEARPGLPFGPVLARMSRRSF